MVQGAMSNDEFEVKLHELSQHIVMIMVTEEELVHKFVKGLSYCLRLATK